MVFVPQRLTELEMAKHEISEDKKWRIEQDLRTLLEAQKIQKDSKRMAAVRTLAKEEAARLESLGKK